jgi:hypothetical protein
MATAQQQTAQQTAAFSAAEAQRFAALMAGFDTGNASEDEALAKGRMLRRMAEKKHFRVIDAFELPEIRQALDRQMQPARHVMPDMASLQTEIADLRGKLAVAVPKLRELAEAMGTIQRKAGVLAGTLIVMLSGVCGLAGYAGAWWCAVAGIVMCSGAMAIAVGGDSVERRLMDLETIKEKAWVYYAWAVNICFALNALTYIACCIVAGGPVGPVSYIGWLYHCCQWGASHG